MDDLLNSLVADLKPIRRRSVRADALAVAAICAAELVVFLVIGMGRPDLAAAFARPIFWWKLASMGSIAAIGLYTALRAFDPLISPRRGLYVALAVVVLALAAGGGFAAVLPAGGDLAARLDWRDGLHCLAFVVGLSIPPVALLAHRMNRGAPTDRTGAALAVGVGSAAWGAFVFVFACPHDDPIYVAFWYSLSCVLTALGVRALLSRLVRW